MRTSCVKNGLVMVVILLFIGVAVQPCVATVQLEEILLESDIDDIEELVAQLMGAVNEKLEKHESKPKLADFWDIILFLLDLFEKILNKIKQTIYGLINCILFLFILLFFG